MSAPLYIKVKDADNVAIAVHDIPRGTEIMPGVVTREDIPQAHKIALTDIPKGGEVVRYGVVLGYAKAPIPVGAWINEHMLDLPQSPGLDDMPYGTSLVPMEELPDPPRRTWMGYRNKTGPAGTRNLLGIVTTVQCAAGVVNVAVERIKRELLPKYPNVDGVVAVNHPYGCGVAIKAREAHIPIRAVTNLIRHPNFGGELMVVGLGCEKLTYDMVLPPEDITPENTLTLQNYRGHDAMMQALMEMAERKLKRLNERRREELPLSELLIGMQCGGSDAFSGLTANPSAGYAADMLVKGGATVLFSEVTEVRDGVHLLAARCRDAAARDKLAAEMKWYDDYLDAGGVDRDANPTPGNKKGGLANIVEKAMGSIAKSGTAPIEEVLSPAEKPHKHGLIYAATPASDIVCGPCQLASGIGLQVFMTGRGTPYGLAAAPVIKVCSRNEMKEHWFDLIDVNAGPIATGEKTIADVGAEQLFPRERIAPADIPAAVAGELSREPFRSKIRPGMSIAITAGSRGIANVDLITRSIVDFVKARGAVPFIVPAMGSHGGATAEGQLEVLASYGITPEAMGCEIRSSMEVVELGTSDTGLPVYLDKNAYEADGIIVSCRLKPHNAFRGPYESGPCKMLAVGLGKQKGAERVHSDGMGKIGANIPSIAKVILARAPILFALPCIENAYDETCRIEAIDRDDILAREPELLQYAFERMPSLLVGACDVLVVDETGKNYSGTGVDPNITGTFSTEYAHGGVEVQRTCFLDLSAASHGNALGVGLANVITKRFFDKIDTEKMYPNCLTSTVLTSARIPCVVANDREAIQMCIRTCTGIDRSRARIIRIPNSLHIGRIMLSEAYYRDVKAGKWPGVAACSEPEPLEFDGDGALLTPIEG